MVGPTAPEREPQVAKQPGWSIDDERAGMCSVGARYQHLEVPAALSASGQRIITVPLKLPHG